MYQSKTFGCGVKHNNTTPAIDRMKSPYDETNSVGSLGLLCSLPTIGQVGIVSIYLLVLFLT